MISDISCVVKTRVSSLLFLLVLFVFTSNVFATDASLVKDINSGSANGSPSYLTVMGGYVYFQATYASNGSEFFRSDGTSDGTTLVKSIRAGKSGSAPAYLAVLSNYVYFQATEGTNGIELWKSDGTESGTVLFKDIYSGASNGDPKYLTTFGNYVYFQANDGTNGIELWRTDGTSDGTVMIKDINGSGSSSPQQFAVLGNYIYFQADDRTNGAELWRSDGTADGTVLVKDINTSGSSSPQYLVALGDYIYFQADDGTNGAELWRTDGTSVGTTLVKDIYSGSSSSSPKYLAVLGNYIYFQAEEATYGIELWKSDGTSVGTGLVKDICTVGELPNGTPTYITAFGNYVYFSGTDGSSGYELWRSDGTDSGTTQADDINSSSSSSPAYLTVLGSYLLFQANNGTNGVELMSFWADIAPPVPSSFFPLSGQILSDDTPTITFSLNENGDCRASTSDESYDDMSDNTDCTGDGTTTISCTLADLGSDGSKDIYISCKDTEGNEDTSSTNEHLIYTLDAKSPSERFKVGLNKDNLRECGEKNINTNRRDIKLFVDVNIGATNTDKIMVSQDKKFKGSSWKDYDGDIKISFSKDGKKSIYVKVKDEAGNISKVCKQTIKINSESPELTITSIDNYVPDFNIYTKYHTDVSTPSIEGTADNDGDVFMYVDNALVKEYFDIKEDSKWIFNDYTFTPGPHLVTIQAKTPGGNSSEISFTLTY